MCLICDNSLDQDALDQIIYLDCSNCKVIQTLPDNLPNLKFLSIYNTNISEIPSYQSLEALYCFNTPLIQLSRLPKLRKLMAQNTNLICIPDDCYRLEFINVNNTNIKCIPETMISLRWMSAENTKLENISSKLISLEWLSIEDTPVEEMPETMVSLQYLNCSGTKITDIHTEGYPMLRKLACQGCSIDPFAFTNGLDVMA